ncbi:MAG: histidine kinase dimerization/phospho-acceptor domain-containing protein [Desulfuromonadaceae bacterium]
MKKYHKNKKYRAILSSEPPEAMAALASGMADDFNNILTTVMGACSLIDRDDPANSELLQYVALIRASAEHAADLSDRLMHAGTSGHGKTASCPVPQDSTSVDTSERDKKTNDAIVPSTNHPGGA